MSASATARGRRSTRTNASGTGFVYSEDAKSFTRTEVLNSLLDRSEPLNATIGTSLRLDVTQASTAHAAGLSNEGYWGIPVKPNTRYRASFYAKAAAGFSGPVDVSIQSNDGKTVFATGKVAALTQAWKQYEVTLQTRSVAPTTAARYVLTALHGRFQG